MPKLSIRNGSLAASLVILLGWGIKSWVKEPAPRPLLGTLLEPRTQIAAFNLTDSKGQSFTRDSLLGKWTVLSFGFTHCPDICPTTLAYFRDELNALPADAPVQFVFIGVDPERDPPEQLGAYINTFHPAIKGVTGSVADVTAFASNFFAYFKKEGIAKDGIYGMAHSPQYFLINPEGQWHVLYTPPMPRGALAIDLKNLAAHKG